MMLHMENSNMLMLVAEIKVVDKTDDDVDKLACSVDVVKSRQVKVKKVMCGYNIGVEALVDIRQVIKVDAELESRFCFCMSNMAYPKYGYGILKVSDGYNVFISWIWRIQEASEDDDGVLDKLSLEPRQKETKSPERSVKPV
nr:hypothetical protein [Tanacetum cinerariifolium]